MWVYISIALFIVCIVFMLWIQLANKQVFKVFKKVNESASLYCEQNNFNITKKYTFFDTATIKSKDKDGLQMIFVDAINKKICLINYKESKYKIVNFDEILDCTIYNSETNGNCVELDLIIKIDNFEMPQFVYHAILNERGVVKSTEEHRIMVNSINEIKAFFDIIRGSNRSIKRKRFIYCRFCGQKNDEESLKCVSCGGGLK